MTPSLWRLARGTTSVGRAVVLLCADASVLILSGVAAYLLWARPVHDQPTSLYLQLLPLVPLFLLGYANAGLYPGFGIGPVEVLRRFSLRTSFAYVLLAGFVFALKIPPVFSRATYLIAWGASLAALPAGRFFLAALLQRQRWWTEPIVIAGSGPRTGHLVADIADAATLGYRPVAVLSPEGATLGPLPADLPVVDTPAQARAVTSESITTALLVPEEDASVSTQVEHLQQHFPRVIMVHGTDAYPVEGVEVRNLGRALGIEFNNQALRPWNRLLKRALDLLLGGMAFLAVLPAMALAALVIRLTTGDTPFYRQEREALGGRALRLLKLRTMVSGAEDELETRLAADPEARAQWERRYKLADDPRIIPGIGRLLRRFSLDEAPQLWQVLKGELSLVGPRPLPEYHLQRFPDDFRHLRRQVRPGVTGLWQVMTRADGDLDDQRIYDTYYIRNWSMWVDLYILARTLGAVLRGRGAF